MNNSTKSIIVPGFSTWIILAAILASGAGCGGGGNEDTVEQDTSTGDVMTDPDDGAGNDDAIADTGRDELAAEAFGDTPTDTDQDTRAPSGVVEVLPGQIVFSCSMTKRFSLATLTVKNIGDADLNVTSIAIADQSCDASNCAFSITAIQLHNPDAGISAGSGPIQPGGFVTVELKFELVGPDTGNNSANLEIASDSVVNPMVVVPMDVMIILPESCRLQMIPDNVNFGVVPVGFPKTAAVRLVNTGTGWCIIDGIKIADCQKNGEEVTCPAPMTGEDSTVFALAPDDTLVGGTVLAGQLAVMKVIYTPPVAGEDTTTYGAILSVQYEDLSGETFVLPSCGGSGTPCAPNLSGAIVLDTNVYPQAVDFGLVRTGCGSVQARVCYYETVDSTQVMVDAGQCGPEFVFEGILDHWDDALKGEPWCVEMAYRPTDDGTDTCTVLFNENGTPVTSQEFTLTGRGSAGDGVTETFTGHQGQTEFDIAGMPTMSSVAITINDLECGVWSVGGTDLDPTIVLGEACPVEHFDEVRITYDLECVTP